MVHTLHSVQYLPIRMDDAWNFFADPGNLRAITPSDLDFVILSDVDGRQVYEGQILRYYVKPLFGIRLSWTTEIKVVNGPAYFKDVQRKGPFALWEHEHFFKPIEGGTQMQDVVHYRLPLGIAGALVHALFIKKKLKAIFEFRFQQIQELFGKGADAPPMHIVFDRNR